MPKVLRHDILISQISCGDDHTVFVSSRKHGSFVYAMGSNEDGKLGIGNVKHICVPTRVETIKDIKKVVAANAHTLALGFSG